MSKSKFEALIEHILNDNTEAARELFHDIVVEKSREIYTDLVREESEGSEGSESESEGSEGSEDVKEAIVDEIGGDAADDMQADIASDEAGMGMDDAADELGSEMGDEGSEEAGEDMGDEEVEDRIVDLEAALDELKAEFDKLMGQEEASHDEGSGMSAGAPEEMPVEGMVREYKEKAPAPVKSESGANTKSIVAGKNDMGGTTANIAKGGANADPNGNSAPKAPKSGDMGAVDPREAGKGAFGKKAPAAKTGESGVNAKSTL